MQRFLPLPDMRNTTAVAAGTEGEANTAQACDAATGPTETSWNIVTANVTSMWTQFAKITSMPAHVALLQETRLTADAQRLMSDDLAEAGWQAFWGKPQPHQDRELWKHEPSIFNAKHGGVAILVKHGIPAKLGAIDSEAAQELWESGRWAHAMVAYGKGATFLHVMT